MNKAKAFITALITGTVGMVGLTPTPAYAADAFHTACENFDNTICLVANDDWTGAVWRQTPSQIYSAANHCRNLTGFDNKATIWYNNTPGGYLLRVWKNTGCTGQVLDVVSGSIKGGWGPNASMNDQASSVSLVAF